MWTALLSPYLVKCSLGLVLYADPSAHSGHPFCPSLSDKMAAAVGWVRVVSHSQTAFLVKAVWLCKTRVRVRD